VINVDFQEMDFGTVVRRRANQELAGQGRLERFFTLIAETGRHFEMFPGFEHCTMPLEA
jgi:hypothetical protein